jgi:hypothetical protein
MVEKLKHTKGVWIREINIHAPFSSKDLEAKNVKKW